MTLTKRDLTAAFHTFSERLEKKFATKDDLKAMEGRQDAKFATKDDFIAMEGRLGAQFSTKDDLRTAEQRLVAKLEAVRTEVVERIDDTHQEVIHTRIALLQSDTLPKR